MNPITLPELKACPFCGGSPAGFAARKTNTPLLEQLSDESGGGWRVICYACHIKTFRLPSAADAAAAWNTRAVEQDRVGRWVSVTDRLPPNGGEYWACLPGGMVLMLRWVVSPRSPEGYWTGGITRDIKHPTHWQEITPPAAPKGEVSHGA